MQHCRVAMANGSAKSQINGEVENSKESICRDFLRNVCRRGKGCRFRHPDPDEAETLGKKELMFCHDFQNKECRRPNCKFLHCSKQDEEYFRSKGHLPDHVKKVKNQECMHNIPACKDYLKGDCKRAGRCKFRHMSLSDYQVSGQDTVSHQYNSCDGYDHYSLYEPQTKRQAFDGTYLEQEIMAERQHYRLLEEENKMLMHKVEELKKQVADLTATNDFLLDQNAQLRVSKQTLVSPISQQLIPHTLTPTLASLPAPSITQLSQLPLSSNLGGGASLAPDLAAATQSMAPMVPVTLGQRIAPVSIASQVTLPPTISASLSQSLPHTLITSTALVSYPIMTQSMRPIPQSMGH